MGSYHDEDSNRALPRWPSAAQIAPSSVKRGNGRRAVFICGSFSRSCDALVRTLNEA